MGAGYVERLRTGPTTKYTFWALLAFVFVLAVGHLYALAGLTTLSLGLPLWLWLQLAVVAAMLAVAWLALSVRRDGGA